MNPPYRTITPRKLEGHIGVRRAIFLFKRNWGNRNYTLGRIDFNSDGEICLEVGMRGKLIRLQHRDTIRLFRNGKGFNSIRDYIFIDDSDWEFYLLVSEDSF